MKPQRAPQLDARRTGACCVMAAGLICAAPSLAAPRTSVLPFAASLESVIEQGHIEGHAVSVLRFRSSDPVAAVVGRLAREWGGPGGAPLVEARSGGWRIVSSFDAGAYRTVQIRPQAAGGSEGLYSVWSPTVRTTARLDPRAILPDTATVLRRVSAVDGARVTTTVVARVDASAAWTLAALDRRLIDLGFVAAPLPRAGSAGGMRVFQRGGHEIAFTVSSHRTTSAIVVHLTEESP